MATKKYGYNQYKPDGPAGMDIVDQELNRYSPAFDYLSGFVTRSNLKQVDDDRTGTSTGGDSTGGDSTGGGSTGGGSSTITNQYNPTINVTGGTQTQQTQAAGGDIVDSGQTNTASTTSTTAGSTNTIDTTTGGDNTGGDNTGGDNTGGDNTGGGNTNFSSEFATEQDAKNYINQYYGSTIGRDAKFGTTTDDSDASYFLNQFASGEIDKGGFESAVKAGDEYKNRLNTVNQYVQDEGRNPTEQELDAIVNPGGSYSSTGNTQGSDFLTDYATKISGADDDTKKAESLSTAITSADDITDVDEKRKYTSMSQGVKDIYSMGLNVGDLQGQTTQTTAGTTKTSSIDQAIKDAYQLLGRDPDKQGYDYWAKQLKADPTFDLSTSFKLSPEYKLKNPT